MVQVESAWIGGSREPEQSEAGNLNFKVMGDAAMVCFS